MKSPGSRLTGERARIRRILDRLPPAPPSLAVGPGDDAAVWTPPRGTLQVLTADALVEGIHFDRALASPADIGYKALAVNVSDVAAMGGIPRLALLSLALPDTIGPDGLDGLVDGLLEMAAESGVAVAGGNITRTDGPLLVDVTVIGSVKPRKVLRRDGARPGDLIYVTGAIGAASAGLQWLRQAADPAGTPDDPALAACVARHRRPAPRARIGRLLGQSRGASACMDLSDGLGDALRQVSEASGTGARLQLTDLPVDPGARRWFEARGEDPVAASAASDDYELLFTVPRRRLGRLRHVMREARGVPVTRIGEVTKDRSIEIRDGDRGLALPSGYEHFS